jgi:hypothetical protein
MYYFVNVVHNSMAVHLTSSDCGFNAVEGTDDDLLWNGSEEDGYVRSDCRKMKALTEDGDSNTDW